MQRQYNCNISHFNQNYKTVLCELEAEIKHWSGRRNKLPFAIELPQNQRDPFGASCGILAPYLKFLRAFPPFTCKHLFGVFVSIQ